ncbi:uncharacterized protein [Diadema antillarum]|uniref:uncharacterized protein n=1 Tax=Diadema antillarum TaxID=105358 RepID=UPI003A8A0B2D
MGGSRGQKKRRAKRGHGKNVHKHADGTPLTRQEVQDLLEERRQVRKAVKKTKGKFSIEQLLEKASDYLDTYEYEMAQRFCQRALQLNPDHVGALEMSGNLLAELGDGEGAMKCLGRAITLSPEEGFSKYMYMGQLQEGLEAVQFFQKGVELMVGERDKKQGEVNGASCSTDGDHASAVTNQDISRAYCSIAEIFLTDACFEDDAEKKCKDALDHALNEDPNNPEAHQLMASFWLSKDDKENAKASIEKSVSLWQQADVDRIRGEETDEEAGRILAYESRVGAAKILMELESFDVAETVLHTLLEEDDEVVQVWYMLGLLQCERKTDECKPPARYYLHKAKKLYCALSCDDEQVLQHIDELLISLGPGEGDEEDWMEKKAREEEEEEEEEEEGGDGIEVDSEASSDEDEEEDMEH